MDDMKERPYVLVKKNHLDSFAVRGIVHSLEECGMPYKIEKGGVDQSCEDSIFECHDAPLGMVIVLGNYEIDIYYSGYNMRVPVLQYKVPKAASEYELYDAARKIGCNAANIIYGKEIKKYNGIQTYEQCCYGRTDGG